MITSYLNTLTDILLFLLPVPLVYKLQMHINQKLAIAVMFLAGLIPVVASIVRNVHLTQSYMDQGNWITRDTSWRWALIPLWSQVETTIGIVAACIPTFNPLMKIIFRRLGLRTARTTTNGNNTNATLTNSKSPTSQNSRSLDINNNNNNGRHYYQQQDDNRTTMLATSVDNIAASYLLHRRRSSHPAIDSDLELGAVDLLDRSSSSSSSSDRPKMDVDIEEGETFYPFRPPLLHNDDDGDDDTMLDAISPISDISLENYFQTHTWGGGSKRQPGSFKRRSQRKKNKKKRAPAEKGEGRLRTAASESSSSMRTTGELLPTTTTEERPVMTARERQQLFLLQRPPPPQLRFVRRATPRMATLTCCSSPSVALPSYGEEGLQKRTVGASGTSDNSRVDGMEAGGPEARDVGGGGAAAAAGAGNVSSGHDGDDDGGGDGRDVVRNRRSKSSFSSADGYYKRWCRSRRTRSEGAASAVVMV
ncbi:hypothetical protein DIS24_g8328 [Lasiodiplodia hormozganensis]|uniref:Rhodopsin domain-containing protein n=1 Tax=Lasiodiplodia hormozganensis TaxID=869390 RepID=A0AA39Y2W2_9PEZI|nr:hypothetical protein DIS24_g8328 [Lasiodiplodia hormozganensis]